MTGYMGRWGIAALVLVTAAAEVQAQNWADQLVDKKKLEFGVIARNSETTNIITITNTTQSTVHISHLTTACRCAEAGYYQDSRSFVQGAPAKSLLQPGEKTTVTVRMNTNSFTGARDTALTVYFDAPQYAEVRIPITAYIRTDVVFDPGKVDFGNVEFLAGSSKTVRITYAGRPDWQIRDLKVDNPQLKAEFKEVSRSQFAQNGINVEYQLTVQLSETAKVGRVRDYITLVTDDAANPYVPLLVEGTVIPDIAITSPNVAIRSLKPGQTTTVKVVIKGNKPFLVEDVNCENMSDCFKVKKSEEPNKLQVVEMEFTAPDKPGKFSEKMIVKVKDREEPLNFVVSGSIL
ncbi:MAG: DUF1573 domain-containing protein [Planctomycetaceae bacterium]|nr:DUF1573 domain-containing protein [Planctomycetaceae bacterium]